jgi:hypothetical protein
VTVLEHLTTFQDAFVQERIPQAALLCLAIPLRSCGAPQWEIFSLINYFGFLMGSDFCSIFELEDEEEGKVETFKINYTITLSSPGQRASERSEGKTMSMMMMIRNESN